MLKAGYRNARQWSNQELRNVSAWRDCDKEGGTYENEYFPHASEYWITNWKSGARGFQGDLPHEIFLDLEQELPANLINCYDVVFNHTTLEHVFDVFKAFENLCALSRDVVIVVVPFLQEQHGTYGDYWRFTPWAVKRLFIRYGLEAAYMNFNDGPKGDIYVFGVGARNKESVRWLSAIEGNKADLIEQTIIGTQRMDDRSRLYKAMRQIYRKLFRKH